MKNIYNCFIIVSILLGLLSCNKENPLKKVDVSKVKIDIPFNRMEKDMFEDTTKAVDEKLKYMRSTYGSIFDLYTIKVMHLGDSKNPLFSKRFDEFLKDVNMKMLYDTVKLKLPDLTSAQNDINAAFKHYAHYFPGKIIPRIYTCITGFNYNIIVADSSVGISLDMYLGSSFKHYLLMGIPAYKVNTMSADYIGRDAIAGWIVSELKEDTKSEDMISRMVYEGRTMYLLDAMIPEKQDSIKIGFTEKELNYCIENEANLWAFFVEKNLLYNTDIREIERYIEEGPFTSTISKDSPARVGVWIGWQIVKSYMAKHPEVTVAQLAQEEDMHKLFLQSKYKPRN